MTQTHKLYLSETDKKIAGVCGGIAERFDVDSTILRLAVVFLALVTAIFPVVITYFIAWVIIPNPPKTKREESTVHASSPPPAHHFSTRSPSPPPYPPGIH